MKFKSNIEVQAGIEDKDGQVGSSGQILASTGSQVDWIDPASIVTSATDVIIECKNTSGVTITKGTPVYQTGNVGATAVIEIAVADASDEDKMAAIGLLQSDLINNAFGYVVVTGGLLNITTSPIDGSTPTVGDTIYVKPGGGLTLTKPTGVNFIQNVGLIGKVSGGNAGSITVSSIMRSNDVPTPLYIDHDNQRLGIGTTSPNTLLDVSSGNFGATAPTVRITNTINVGDWSPVTSDLGRFEFFTDDTSGNAPYTLGYIGIKNDYTTGAPTLPSGAMVFATTTYNALGGAVERMRIDSSGNVGIGTTSPGTLLEISGNSQASTPALRVNCTDSSVQLNQVAGAVQFSVNDASTPGAGVKTSINSIALNSIGSSYGLGFNTTSGVNNVERMRIDSDGNVGIGTTSPPKKLSISGTKNTSIIRLGSTTNGSSWSIGDKIGAIEFSSADGSGAGSGVKASISYEVEAGTTGSTNSMVFSTAGTSAGTNNTERMRITAAGNVGIGTTSPSQKLEISTAAGNSSIRLSGGAANNETYDIGQGIAGVSNGGFSFMNVATGTETMVFQYSTGNVGIGTTSPAYQLTLGGNAVGSTEGLRINDPSNAAYGAHFSFSDTPSEVWIGGVTNNTYNSAISIHRDTTRAITIDINSNVGIGTTNPGSKLDVKSLATTAETIAQFGNGNIQGGLKIKTNGNLEWGLETLNARSLTLGTNNTERMRIDTVGAVIIGDQPKIDTATKLQVSGSSSGVTSIWSNADDIVFQNNNNVGITLASPNTGIATIAFADPESVQAGFIQYKHTDNSMSFATNGNNTRIFINSSGNVGIGTTTPDARLDVDKSVIIGSESTATSTTNIENVLKVKGKNNYSDGTTWYGDYGQILLSATNNMTSSARQFLITNALDNNKFAIIRSTDWSTPPLTNSTAAGVNSGTADFVIDNGGSIGIGTTSPDAKLDVNGAVITRGNLGFINYATQSEAYYTKIGTQYNYNESFVIEHKQQKIMTYSDSDGLGLALNGAGLIRFMNGSNERMRISGNGNVGIGTTNPRTKLNVKGASSEGGGVLTLENSTTSTGIADYVGKIQFYGNDSGTGASGIRASIDANIQGYNGETDLVFSTAPASGANTEAMRIDQNGNVGIGTTSPQAKLHVSGGSSIETTLIVGAEGTGSDKSARVFLNEGEGGVSNSKDYGFSLAYDGQGAQYGGLSANQFGILRHNNSAVGGAVMVMNRTNNNTTFTGTVTGTNFILSSDERLKKNIEEVDNKSIKADWKTFELKTEKGQKRYGVIAQELEKTNPEFVREDTQGFKSVAYIDLLIAKIAELEARLEKLEK